MALKTQKIMADLETTVDPKDVRAWAVGAVDIETLETRYVGNDLGKFMEWLSDKNTVCYFHNAKFDLEFVLSWLLKNGYQHSHKPKEKCFTTLITDDGIFYAVEVFFKRGNKKWCKVKFYDSLKKLPFKVAVIAKAFELEESKGSIDYAAYRPVGHELTENEKDYLLTDCRIVAKALQIQFAEGLTKMTNASDAMNGYKAVIGKNTFEKWFPVLPLQVDDEIRAAYKGGYVYLNPKYQGIRGLQGMTLDVNSLYPSVMYNQLLPYGYPVYFEGEPVEDETRPLYIVKISCAFELKEGHLPTIQIKKGFRFNPVEYLTSSRDDKGVLKIVEMTLTNVDLALFLEHYKTLNLTYINGYRFKGAHGMFKDYIDHWSHIKETTTGAKRQLAKLMLNSLYGRFATNPRSGKKIPYLDEEGVVRYKADELEIRDPVYTAMGAFITAYARDKTIRSAQAVYDRFIYADTDSLHLVGQTDPEGLKIHPTRLGAWKNEGNFEDSLFLRAKTYMETVDGVNKITCAGMPDNVKEQVTYDNFRSGATFTGKLLPRRYAGGVVLTDTTFTIK